LAYASRHGRALIDRELYMPASWLADRERCRKAAVPDQVEFATKPAQAQTMIARAVTAGVPFAWVTADEAYGQATYLRHWLEDLNVFHVLAVRCTDPVTTADGPATVKALVTALPEHAWRRRSAGAGAHGERLYDWARIALPAPATGPTAGRGRWVLARRRICDGEIAYYMCYGPAATTLNRLITIAAARWQIEECFQAAKGEAGLDHYQVRRYDAWYRHITLSMLAHAYLAATAAACRDSHRDQSRAATAQKGTHRLWTTSGARQPI
jgi:SRSO17 transposase